MNANTDLDHDDPRERDPLGLGRLPLLEPDRDGWSEIRDALEADQARRGRWRSTLPWLAAAASVLLAVGVVNYLPHGQSPGVRLPPGPATETGQTASVPDKAVVERLIATSQVLEQRLHALRDETGAMPADTLMYVAELEDLIAQVDEHLSEQPDSVDLWGQRVNLLLDLEVIYQHHWEREYGRMASL